MRQTKACSNWGGTFN